MPPSTVFSYWRRDHRRSTAPVPPPVGSKSATASPISPPQLANSYETSVSKELPGDSHGSVTDGSIHHGHPPERLTSKSTTLQDSVAAYSSSTPSLARHTPPSTDSERTPGEAELVQSIPKSQSQTTLPLPVPDARLEHGEPESNSKPNSPFRMSLAKGLRNLQVSPAEMHRRSPSAGQSPFRRRMSPEEPSIERSMGTHQKDARMEPTPATATIRRGGNNGGVGGGGGGTDREGSMEQSNHKSGKAMLHLLNPMALLARRRSAQLSSSRVDDTKISTPDSIPAIPDDYDPRIRGKIVHDFSAPRPRRNVSWSSALVADGGHGSRSSEDRRWNDQVPSTNHDHSPAFKEHFEDETAVPQVENTGYLHSTLMTNASQTSDGDMSLPVFARKLPSEVPEHEPEPKPEPESEPEKQELSPSTSIVEDKIDIRHTKKSVRVAPQNIIAQQPDHDAIPLVPQANFGLPRHLKSNASRFSFDMGGVESSTQERLLEEKHKEKEARRKIEGGYFDDFDDDFDNDMLDDFEGLEEKIPGVNADADDEDYLDPSMIKSWAVPGLSPVIASPIVPAPPTLHESQMEDTFDELDGVSPEIEESGAAQHDMAVSNGLQATQPPIAPLGVETAKHDAQDLPATYSHHLDSIDGDEDDDLYFDDGEFGDLSLGEQEHGFDESVFDDETSHLYARKPVMPPIEPQQRDAASTAIDHENLEDQLLHEESTSEGLKHMNSVAGAADSIKRGPLGEPIPNMGPLRTHGGVLTEQNLEVLHNALAFAASEAASRGRYEHASSTSERSAAQESISQASHTAESQPGLVSDDSRLSQGADMASFDDFLDDRIYDDYDDDYYDDPIVAAANAEALENDDEGFYGQEFGFYAQAHGADGGEMTNGGYFGPRGVEGLTRRHSSRGKFEEPSLTPITERSEWSTRNSIISVKAHGAAHSNPSMPSPGLAQLVDLNSLDDDMSLSALMKLRRGAWGGSNGSLRSGAASPQPHTLPSSARGSFNGTTEASPSEIRSFADESPAVAGPSRDENHETDSRHSS
ncbi:hypothetical protein N7539_001226 [Penicillium diatomitis]|uniref:AGC-kinase C-terminal domain-containing protein n=1 Tax=Penicillium diatomitis TaxID=2819901 RepID=A0A9W9XP21_9EURO|nr:uncharacterized protein N7539_001226 [Penicillium diatomitis]KAJ5496110.1 hypothetical protein N7539_001226 [Penicillium diatomitis]